MRLTRLIARDVRNLKAIDWRPAPGLNLLVGPNGGGKTSVLEAIHLAALGRSFRTRDTSQIVRHGTLGLSISAWFETPDQRDFHVRMDRDGSGTRLSLDGRQLRAASELARTLPILPLSQDGVRRFRMSRGERRSLLDWGLFHVEPEFHRSWVRYHTALAQRNAALRSGQPSKPWLEALVGDGELLTKSREAYVLRLQSHVERVSERLELGLEVTLEFSRGWRDGLPLAAYWSEAENSDRKLGYTSGGPHRANLGFRSRDRLGMEQMSAGQAKLLYLVLRLAQLDELLDGQPEPTPIVFVDDLAAELDNRHVTAVLATLAAHKLQRFVTSPAFDADLVADADALFHVEQGALLSAPH
ncbi:DNA replication/repair protein RecF [Immundisolibacter sp.]|uniref:DNA replication/repair protein RecF n=1 Tax=Immundisolibacter sp. TaxID=1934948 RepID=UPI003563A78B